MGKLKMREAGIWPVPRYHNNHNPELREHVGHPGGRRGWSERRPQHWQGVKHLDTAWSRHWCIATMRRRVDPSGDRTRKLFELSGRVACLPRRSGGGWVSTESRAGAARRKASHRTDNDHVDAVAAGGGKVLGRSYFGSSNPVSPAFAI